MIELVGGPPDRATATAPPERSVYRLAGHRVTVSPPLPEIEGFRDPLPAPPPVVDRPPHLAGPEAGTPVYRGPAWIGQRERTVTCRRAAHGLRVDIEGIGRLEVAGDGRHAALVDPAPASASDADAGLRAEALLGPALILALAFRGTFCFHASALAVPSVSDGPSASSEAAEAAEATDGLALVAFLGPSGAGKSTLARLLDGARPGWHRAADDVLPLAWEWAAGGAPTAYPRFPQLKLDPAAQPGARLPEAIPLAALFVLAPGPAERPAERAVEGAPDGPPGRPGQSGQPVVRRLKRAEAALALVRHTASARLFDRVLLARHLELCSALAERLPVAELTYPWRGALVPGLADAVASALEAA